MDSVNGIWDWTYSEAVIQLSIFSELPFYSEGLKEVKQKVRRKRNPYYRPIVPLWTKYRGNYVRSYVLSNLRIQVKSTRLPVAWNLEALWRLLPIDLIIAIFGFLHPIDLYHAIRATKGLRRFLLNRSSTTIWKESFLNHPDIPFYPDDVSPPKWASLIFGPATCDLCGTANTLVDYAFRWRRCDDCSDCLYPGEDNMISAISRILGPFPDQLDDVWKLATNTHRISSFSYPDKDNLLSLYSLKQVKSVAWRMRNLYLVYIWAGTTANAKSNYETFVNATKVANDEHLKHVRLCERWAKDIEERSKTAFVDSIPAFGATCTKVLMKRGCNPKDVSLEVKQLGWSMHPNWATISDPNLSKSNLWKYLPRIMTELAIFKRRRLIDEHDRRTRARREKVLDFYLDLIGANYLYPIRLHLPNISFIFSLFAKYIADPQETVVELPVDSARRTLDFIETKLAEKIQPLSKLLFKLMLNAGVLPDTANDDSNPADFIGLAIAVFECCGSAFAGWDEVGIHECKNGKSYLEGGVDSPFLATFSNVGYQALRNLAELLRLGSLDSALAKDLDSMNSRFVCKTCPLNGNGKDGVCLAAMTWRECLCHAVQVQASPLQDRHVPAFDILSEPLTKSIHFLESAHPTSDESDWCCRYCHIYTLPACAMREGSRYTRAIFNNRRIVKRCPFFIGLHSEANHQCLHCPDSHEKLWDMKKADTFTDLCHHLLYQHKIQSQDLVEGVDWIKIKAVEDDTWIREKICSRTHYAA